MRNFLIATSYGTSEGQVGIYVHKNNTLVDIRGVDLENQIDYKEFQLVLHRSAENGGNVVLPIYPNNLSYSVMVAESADHFKYHAQIPAPTYIGDYSIMIIKKGVGFNERNKWTATVHVTDTSMTADELTNKLIDAINKNSEASGVSAENFTYGDFKSLLIRGIEAGVDYEIKGADHLFGVDLRIVDSAADYISGWKGLLTPAHVKDLLDKAAADAGYEYTYTDGLDKLYPGYFSVNGNIPELTDLITIRFAEPRQVRTVDHEINQIVQIGITDNGSELDIVLGAMTQRFGSTATDH